MKRYIKIIIRDEHGRSEDTMRDATEVQTLAARRACAQLFTDEPITDEQWAEVVAKVERARAARKEATP